VQVPPEAVAAQLPAPLEGAASVEQGAPWQTGNADHDPAVHVRVVEPLMRPLGHVMVQVPPLGVTLQVPVAYCAGGLVSAGHVGLLQTGKADHTPLVQVRVAVPDCKP